MQTQITKQRNQGALAERLGVNRVVLALSIARMADGLGNSILVVIIPLYVARLPSPLFDLPESVLIGILISWFGVVNTVLQPLMGSISDRMGKRKPFILIGLFLMAVGTLAFIFAGRFTDLVLIRALQAVGVAMSIPTSLALMAASTTKETRGSAMGVWGTLRMIGFAIGPMLGGFIEVNWGFNVAFVVGAGLVFLSLILVQFWVDEKGLLEDIEAAQPENGGPKPDVPGFFDRRMWSGDLFGLAAAIFAMAIAFSLMAALENEFNARLGLSTIAFGIAYSSMTISRLFVQFPLGRMSDRIGRKPLIVTGLVLMAPATLALGLAAANWQLVAGRAFQGIAAAAIGPAAMAMTGDISPVGGEGRQMSIMTMSFFVGTALGPLIAGTLVLHSFVLPFLVGGLICLPCAWLVSRYVKETIERKDAAESEFIEA
ncbi:MAG: MFS transporter [Anaerolineales bacterium]|nr:MFS transporter [Anaerolineales bacterium]